MIHSTGGQPKVTGQLRTAVGLAWTAGRTATLVTLGATVVLGLGPVVTAWCGKLLIDQLSGGGQVSATALAPLIIAVAVALLATYLGDACVAYLQDQHARRIEAIVQGRLFSKLNSLPGLALLERPVFHDRIHLALQAGQTAPQQLVSSGRSLIHSSVQLAGFIGVLLAISPSAALFVAVAAVPRLIAERRLAKERIGLLSALSPVHRRQYFYSRLQSDPRAAKELRVFGLGEFFRRRMLNELARIHSSQRKLDLRVMRTQGWLDALSVVAMALAVFVVVLQAAASRATPGDIAVILTALPIMAGATAAAVRQLAYGGEALVTIGHYLDIMALDEARPVPVADSVPPLGGDIVFDDVWFRYGDDLPWVLEGVSFRIPWCGSVGLVGSNGAGKSTVVKLLAGLYQPTKGSIRWNGIDLRELDPEQLRQRIGMVFQDYMTYDLTALENIGIGDLEAGFDLQRIRSAADLANVDATIEELPRGYQTMLSLMHQPADADATVTGVALSGGQWQRLALARMLLRSDRDLLILDEPSSGLDPEAEHRMHRVVLTHTSGTTRLLVSHRLNAVRIADHIVVLEDGRISQAGCHAELLRRGGRYADMFRLQADGYRDDDPSRAMTAPTTDVTGNGPNSRESIPAPASPTTKM